MSRYSGPSGRLTYNSQLSSAFSVPVYVCFTVTLVVPAKANSMEDSKNKDAEQFPEER